MKYVMTLCLLLLTSFNAQASEVDCQLHHCLAVIDAGSTKSYLHVYQYDVNDHDFPTQIEEIAAQKVLPGLATIKVEAVSDYMERLMAGLPLSSIPVYLYATAGMRLLPESEQAQRYEAVKHWFVEHPTFQLKAAKTITGKEEAILDWLAVNFQKGRFTNGDRPYLSVMDMGGASVQVAYPFNSPVNAGIGVDADDIVTLSVNGRQTKLFVHSFLGLGQNEVMKKFVSEPACFSVGYMLTGQSLLGTGQWQDCKNQMESMVAAFDVDIIVNRFISQFNATDWYVMGGLSALMKKPAFQVNGDVLYPTDLSQKAPMVFCETPWDILKNTDPSDSYLPTSCMASAYYYALLTKGYGLNEQQAIQFARTDADDAWAPGVLMLSLDAS